MPYIKKEDRSKFQVEANRIGRLSSCGGDLNYSISTIIDAYIQQKGLRYSVIQEVVGALECCKLEIYRRIAAGYEDQKIVENGDVFGDKKV